jgi:tetratricopeptide (TPR) repeat protein
MSTAPRSFPFWAFISYSRADRTAGERFQRAIEHYRIPKSLRGQDRGFGTVPKYLTPLFRDQSDAIAGPSLAAELEEGLEQSGALVPLCSPTAAQSKWVNLEIRKFKALGRGQRIVPVIIEGTPRRYDPDRAPDGAFPPALFQRVDSTGDVIADDDPEPLAADIRPSGDGFDLAKLKVVAHLTGIPLAELTERQFEAERRERKIVRLVLAGVATLAVIAIAAAVVAYNSAEAARTRLSKSIEMAARRVDDGARFGDTHGVPIEVIRKLLAGAERDFTTLIEDGSWNPPMLELQRGRLLVLFSNLYGKVGDREQQLGRAKEGLTTLERIPIRRRLLEPRTWLATLPSEHDVVGEQLLAIETVALAQSDGSGDGAAIVARLEEGRDRATRAGRYDFVARFWSRLGQHFYATGETARARTAQDAALAALQEYLGTDGPPTAERAAALTDRAQLLSEMGRHKEALDEQTKAVDAFEALAALPTADNSARQSLAQALTRRADMQYGISGKWDETIPAFERALEIFESAHASDPTRIDYARNLTVALERFGDARLQMGDRPRARALFDRLVALRRTRLERDPTSRQAHRDLAVAIERHGDLAIAEAQPAKALTFYDEARALRVAAEQGADESAQSRVFAHDLAILWSKTASARAAAKAPGWADEFETAIARIADLIAKNPKQSGWLRDETVFRYLYGEALSAAGRHADARRQWAAALELNAKQRGIEGDGPVLVKDRAQLESLLGVAGSDSGARIPGSRGSKVPGAKVPGAKVPGFKVPGSGTEGSRGRDGGRASASRP